MATKTLTTTLVVKNEAELNSAIEKVNQSQANIIDVQSSFSLTKNTVTVQQSMLLKSSNGSGIQCNGFVGLSMTDGATVSLSMFVDGPVSVHSSGDGTTLIGLNGGQVGNLLSNGNFQVPFDNTFTASFIQGSANICGTLKNAPINAAGPYIVVSNTSEHDRNTTAIGHVNDVVLSGEAIMIIQSGTVFHAQKVTVDELSSIVPDGSAHGTLSVSNGLEIVGQNTLQMPGMVSQINVKGNVTLKGGGIYGAPDAGGHTGGQATEINNLSGKFRLGHEGTWQVGTYTQQQGKLTLDVTYSGTNDNRYRAPVLEAGSLTIDGGHIEINARTYYVPTGFREQKLLIMKASSHLSIPMLQSLVKFVGFPPGLKTTVSQEGNNVYLTIFNEGAHKAKPPVCDKA